MQTITLTQLESRLATILGPSGWWPADSPTEILVGAILVQNTNWRNVAASLTNLRAATGFTPRRLFALSTAQLQPLTRPSGFYRNKARAMLALGQWLATRNNDLTAIAALPPAQLRQELLALPGIGPETADAMRLYVFNQPTFIADHYCRRLFTWLGQPVETYAKLRAQTKAVDAWPLHAAQELHGLIDNFGKTVKTAADFAVSQLADVKLTLPAGPWEENL